MIYQTSLIYHLYIIKSSVGIQMSAVCSIGKRNFNMAQVVEMSLANSFQAMSLQIQQVLIIMEIYFRES